VQIDDGMDFEGRGKTEGDGASAGDVEVPELPEVFKRFKWYYELAMIRPDEGQFAFTMTGLWSTALISLHHFRYRSASNYYDNGDFSGTNYWKIANFVSMYGGVSIMGLATLT